MVLKAGEGAGRSGSFFFFSFDNKYLVKTIPSNDKAKLDNLIYKYHDHISNLNKEGKSSLLARIYGVYTIDCKFFDPVYVIVMQNTSMMINPKMKKYAFDMKGSKDKRSSKFNLMKLDKFNDKEKTIEKGTLYQKTFQKIKSMKHTK